MRAGPGRLLVALTLALSSAGGAARAEANGVKFGEGRVHPFFQFESRYDSATVLVSNPSGTGYAIDGDMPMHFKPGLKLDMPSETFAVGLKGNLDYVLYPGLINPGTTYASHLEGDADLDLGINRGGQIGLDLGDHVVRSDRAMVPSLAVGVLSLYNDARARLNWHPTGGALQVEPRYNLTTEFFSPLGGGGIIPPNCPSDADCNPNSVGKHDYIHHNLGLDARWRFLPKTALVLDANYGLRSYFGSDGTPIQMLKASVGLAGLVSTRFTTVLKLGWAQDFTAGSFSSLIAHAELGYLLSQTGQVRAGYIRNFEPVGGGFVSYGDDRAYLDGRLLLGGKLTARGALNVDFLSFRGASPRYDERVSTDVGADYEAANWLTVGGGYVFTWQTHILGLDDFYRNEVYLRAQAMY